jgi:hypothetical protein
MFRLAMSPAKSRRQHDLLKFENVIIAKIYETRSLFGLDVSQCQTHVKTSTNMITLKLCQRVGVRASYAKTNRLTS